MRLINVSNKSFIIILSVRQDLKRSIIDNSCTSTFTYDVKDKILSKQDREDKKDCEAGSKDISYLSSFRDSVQIKYRKAEGCS